MLLQASVDAMSGTTFTLKDLIYICVILVGGVSAFVTLKISVKGVKEKQLEDSKNHKEDLVNTTNGRRAVKKELKELIREKDDTIHKRVDKTQKDMRSYQDKTDVEFKSINDKLSEVKSETSEIKGMLTQLVNK